MLFYVDGAFVPAEQAKISVTDRGVLYGDGCYESIGVWDGAVVQLDEHLARLERSAAALRIPLPRPLPQLRELVLETARRNGMHETAAGYVRPLITRGDGPMGVAQVETPTGPTLVVLAAVSAYDPRGLTPGTAIVSTVVRQSAATLDPRIKSTNYLASVMAALEAKDRGADVGILLDPDGNVAEGHAMNLFCVRDGVLCAPPDTVSLAGITRGQVLRVAASLGIACVEGALAPGDFATADEIFTTSASRGMMPIGRFDDYELSAPGPVTARLHAAYVEHVRATATPVPA